MSSFNPFSCPYSQLESITQQVLELARARGATDCVAEASEGTGLSVTVRRGKVETIEQNRDRSIDIGAYIGRHRGQASTSDFSTRALQDTVQAAIDIARFTADDDCNGLPDEHLLQRQPRDLKLFYAWDIDATAAIELAQRAEAAAFAVDRSIGNTEGATLSAQHSQYVLANSRQFLGGSRQSQHYLSVAPIAGKGRNMQRDDWYSADRNPALLAAPEAIGRYAAQRALARLGARKLSTRKCPVLFEAPLATGLLNSFVYAVSGGSLYRKSSFLLDSMGKQVFAPHLQMIDDPDIFGAAGSGSFDEEGVRTMRRQVVRDGIVEGYFLSTYSARKLGMETTGNAGGAHNLSLTSTLTKSSDDFQVMLKKLDTGLLVTDLMGQGVNYVTGDYSRGASGFWVQGGVIQYPVEEITIAANMADMFKDIVAIGADTIVRGTKTTGSILIAEMTIAGD